MESDELLARLDERFKAQKEIFNQRFDEQGLKNKTLFELLNSTIIPAVAKLEELSKKVDKHIDNHWGWVTIFGAALGIIYGFIEFLHSKLK